MFKKFFEVNTQLGPIERQLGIALQDWLEEHYPDVQEGPFLVVDTPNKRVALSFYLRPARDQHQQPEHRIELYADLDKDAIVIEMESLIEDIPSYKPPRGKHGVNFSG